MDKPCVEFSLKTFPAPLFVFVSASSNSSLYFLSPTSNPNLKMHFSFFALLSAAATTFAQGPISTNFTDLGAIYQFDQAAALFTADPEANAILNGPKKVTVLLPANIPLLKYISRLFAISESEAKQQLANGFGNRTRNSELLRYVILDGVYSSSDLFGGAKFLPSFLVDPRTYRLSQPAKVGIVHTASEFYVRTGRNATSPVVIQVRHRTTIQPTPPKTKEQDIPFSNGLIHLLSFPVSELDTIFNTGTILDIKSLQRLSSPRGFPTVQSLTDVTVFAPSNKVRTDRIRNWTDYFVAGNVAYSTDLTAGTTLRAFSRRRLVITEDEGGRKYVNGVRILDTDILTSNGVVHLIDGWVFTLSFFFQCGS